MSKGKIIIDVAELEQLLDSAVKRTVNGKIDKVYAHQKLTDQRIARLHKRVEDRDKEILPYLQGLKFLKRLGSVAAAVAAFYASLKIVFPNLPL